MLYNGGKSKSSECGHKRRGYVMRMRKIHIKTLNKPLIGIYI